MRKMCFLVAKQFNQIGCFALQTEGGKSLVEIKRRLENEFGDSSLQLVTISLLLLMVSMNHTPLCLVN